MGLLLYLLRDVRMVHREGMQALAVRTHGRVPTIVSEPSIVPKKNANSTSVAAPRAGVHYKRTQS